MKYKLKDIVTTLGDGIHGTPTFDESGEYYFFNGNNIENGNLVIKSDTKKVNFEEYKKYKKNLNNRTILVSINGTIGKVGIYNNEKCILGKSACYFNVKEEVNRDYIKFLLMNRNFQEYIKNYSTGTTIKNMSLKAMKEFEFELPIRSIQDKVAHILNSIERKIELNIHTNNNLYEIGRAIYQEYFENEKYTSSYETKQLSEVTTNNRNKIDKNKECKVLSAVNTGKLVLSDDYFDKQVYSKDIGKYLNVNKNDFAYNPARINIGSIGLNTYDFNCCVSPVYVTFSVDKDYIDFFDFYFKSKRFNAEVTLRASGSVRQALSYNDFGMIEILYPSKEMINKFNKSYSKIKNRINKNKMKINNLEQIRDTLLPKLMNGEIDIDKIEI